MEPRFLIKTHAQVSHPGIFAVLIERCTGPERASNADRVARNLADALASDDHQFKAAARFTVLMAQQFGFVRRNMTWDSNGFVIHAALSRIGKTGSQLPPQLDAYAYSLHERIAYLRYYLEADGAVIWSLLSRLAGGSPLTRQAIGEQIQDIFIEIHEDYLLFMDDTRARTRVRASLARLRRERYKPGTVPHKVGPHIQPLVDLGVLEESKSMELVGVGGKGVRGPSRLLSLVDSLASLERLFAKEEYFSAVAALLVDQPNPFEPSQHDELSAASIRDGYRWMKSDTTALAHVDALCDWVCVDLLATHGLLLERNEVRRQLREWNRDGRVRFDVDHRGHPAFVALRT